MTALSYLRQLASATHQFGFNKTRLSHRRRFALLGRRRAGSSRWIANHRMIGLNQCKFVALQQEAGLKIAIVDESPARAAVIEEGLREAGLADVVVLLDRHGLAARLESLAPDVVLINLENPGRDQLEESFALSRALARPIAMFVDQSDERAIAEAVDAGISAYVVDGLRKDRIKPILELAVRRFKAFARLQSELAEARSALAERKIVDRAKAILMKRRAIDEPTAYALLRKQAMDGGRRIADIAEALVTADALLGGDS